VGQAPSGCPGRAVGRSVAFVDEAIRERWYVLAATVLIEDDAERIREHLHGLLLRGQQRLHWREESAPRRAKLASAVCATGCTSVVVVGIGMDQRKQERARRRCLGRLLWELDQLRDERGVAETRHAERNATDIRAFGAFRKSGMVSAALSFEHGRPAQEPLLWLPDIVAGAVLSGRTGRSELRLALEDTLTEIEIEVG